MKDFLQQQIFLPAPLEGVMRPAVIEACNDLELTRVWVTPFLRVSGHVPKERELKEFMRPFAPERCRVILQIMGTCAERLAETALRGIAAGAAGIDLNCGCPSSQVVAHGAGAGCLRQTERTAEIIRAIRQAVGKSFFSVKTRLGFDDWNECKEFLPLWESAGAPDMFTLHYRTAREGYRVTPGREERLTAARQSVKNALVWVNGDITTVSEGEDLIRLVQAHGAMIGRAFWRDPFMFKRRLEGFSVPDPEAGRKILLQKLLALPYSKSWTLGSAIELASLIAGSNSPEAVQLKQAHSKKCS